MRMQMTLKHFNECWDSSSIKTKNNNELLVVFDEKNTITKVLQDGKNILCNV